MFLNCYSTRLNKVSASFLRSHPIAYFSRDETTKDSKDKKEKFEEKSATKKDDSQAQQKERIKNLLSKLSKNSALHIVREVQTAKPMGYKKIMEKQGQKNDKPKKTIDAVKAVAKEIGGGKVVNDLLDSINSTKADDDSEDLDVVLAMMQTSKKVDKKTNARNSSNNTMDNNSTSKPRTQFMGRFRGPTREPLSKDSKDMMKNIDDRRHSRVVSSSLVSIFGGTPLDIFEVGKLIDHEYSSKTRNELEKHEFRLKMSYAPRNYFEKMAYWTEEGKIWKFPIDNEQGLDTEHQTPFTDHVFLEDLLEPWCPEKGAVRNFMELICIGLSKNPYLTVQEKREHIEWYRNYFDEKSHILQNVAEQNELHLKQAATKLIE